MKAFAKAQDFMKPAEEFKSLQVFYVRFHKSIQNFSI